MTSRRTGPRAAGPHRERKRWLVLLIAASLWLPFGAFADEPPADEVDHVALAARLAADGHFDRAKSVLTGVPVPEDAEQAADYHTVLGLVALRESQFKVATEHLDQAIFAGKTDDVIFVYLAQAYWGLQDYETTVRMIRNADEQAEQSASLQVIRAQSLWKMGRMHEVYRVLHHNTMKFPDEPQFHRMLVFLLVELGLFQEATRLAEDYFAAEDEVGADDYVAFGQALLASGQTDTAVLFLERANLRFPTDPRVATQFARTLLAAGMPVAAGELLQRVALDDDTLTAEAAEMFRRGGAYDRALYMNAQIAEQKAKLRQRVGILTDQQDFESVAAMEDRLERLDLLADQNVLYGVAYARFQIGDYEGAEQLIKRITDPQLFENATKLRQVMAYCAENPC